MKRQLLIALSTFTLFLMCSPFALAQTIAPGGKLEFMRADNGSSDSDAGGAGAGEAITAPSFSAPPRTVFARAQATGALNVNADAFANIYNDFSVDAGDNGPRVLSAQIKVRAEWNGRIDKEVSGSARVKILIYFYDLSAGGKQVIEPVVAHERSSGGNDTGNADISFQAPVTRGHRYRITFELSCSASCGFPGGKGNCDFSSDTRRARWTSMSVELERDLFDLFSVLDGVNTKLDSLSARLDALQISVNTANTRLVSVESKVDIANNTINVVNGKVDAVNNKLDARLDVAVSTRASQTSVDVLTGKVDDLAAALEAFKKLTLRTEIEAALVEGDRYNVAHYQVPEAAGRYLELVRSIVADSIESCRKAGLNSFALGQAQGALASGDQYFAAKGYKDAYDQYRAAYLHLSIVPGNHRP